MTTFLYVKLDVNYADDAKIAAVTTGAELLYIRALCFAKRVLSDGAITTDQLMRIGSDIPDDSLDFGAVQKYASELVTVGLWETLPSGGGWRIRAWSKHNATAGEVEEKRSAKADGGALGNHRRWHKDKRSDGCRYCESEDRSLSESTEEETEEEEEEETKGGRPRRRATALPKAWQPTQAHADLATKLDVNIAAELDVFRDHAKTNGRTAKDWDAAFRNWLRKAAEYAARNAGNARGKPTAGDIAAGYDQLAEHLEAQGR